jgi:4-alpha-glucanotransferase
MKFNRSAGILLHITSLPSEFGIGDLGKEAYNWLDFLNRAGCGIWQILPLGPTGYGDSPYQCFSSFAGNPYLISPELLFADGLLTENNLFDRPDYPAERVDYSQVIPWKLGLLDKAFEKFEATSEPRLSSEFFDFKASQAFWLDDFTVFMALKDAHHGTPWDSWEAALRDHEPKALEKAENKLEKEIARHAFRQFVFFRQWNALHRRAKELGITILGDIPIFTAHDSSDVWANPELFYLDKNKKPSVVAGVPPDYFSQTGQRWGNPLYRWNIHAEDGYAWWIKRLKSTLSMVDIVRLDHFRGFASYWEIPGSAPTAEMGRWVHGPGKRFFRAVKNALGDLPIIAEDLGVITPDVIDLREEFNLAGMKVLQFAFANGPQDPFLPHNYPRNCAAYTGTHDNDTVRGWYERVTEEEKEFYRRYLNRDGSQVAWDLIRACWGSVATYAIAPLQDFLDLGNEARMNYPSSLGGNWTWRVAAESIDNDLAKRIREINYLYGRLKPNLD